MFVSGAPRGVVAESRVSVDGTMQTVDGRPEISQVKPLGLLWLIGQGPVVWDVTMPDGDVLYLTSV
jgi:hypothetical protein